MPVSYLLLNGMVQCIGVLKLRLHEFVFVDATTQADQIRNWLLRIHHLNCLHSVKVSKPNICTALYHNLLAICRPSGCTVASGIVGGIVSSICNHSQMRTSK